MCKIGSIRASFHVLLCLYWDVVCYCLSRQTLLRCNLAPHCLPSWSPSRQQIVEGCCLWRLQNKFGKKTKIHGVIIRHERLKQRGQDGEIDSRYLQNRTAGVFGKIDLPAVCWTQGKLENFDSKVAKSRFWTSGF